MSRFTVRFLAYFSALTAFYAVLLPFYAQAQHSKHRPARTHEEQMSAMFQQPKKPVQTIGILVYDDFTTLDAMGPYQVLSEMMGTKVFFIARTKGIVRSGTGLKLQVDADITDVDSLDILLVPGGFKSTYLLTQDSTLLAWIRTIDKTTVYTTSVCTGAWILGAAGLLKGKNATTHWYGKEVLSNDYGARVKNERWVRDGKLWTSAGVTAGMDMCLALVQEIMGDAYTKAAMLDLEYAPKPPLKAGTEFNTNKAIVEMMRGMYDGGLKPLRDSVRNQTKR
jgi:putative intracellular protease/amidase